MNAQNTSSVAKIIYGILEGVGLASDIFPTLYITILWLKRFTISDYYTDQILLSCLKVGSDMFNGLCLTPYNMIADMIKLYNKICHHIFELALLA